MSLANAGLRLALLGIALAHPAGRATTAARQKHLALSAADRKEDEAFRRNATPSPKDLASQIRAGGRLSFQGEQAVLAVVANATTRNADGSTTSSSSSTTIGFATAHGKWRIAEGSSAPSATDAWVAREVRRFASGGTT